MGLAVDRTRLRIGRAVLAEFANIAADATAVGFAAKLRARTALPSPRVWLSTGSISVLRGWYRAARRSLQVVHECVLDEKAFASASVGVDLKLELVRTLIVRTGLVIRDREALLPVAPLINNHVTRPAIVASPK